MFTKRLSKQHFLGIPYHCIGYIQVVSTYFDTIVHWQLQNVLHMCHALVDCLSVKKVMSYLKLIILFFMLGHRRSTHCQGAYFKVNKMVRDEYYSESCYNLRPTIPWDG